MEDKYTEEVVRRRTITKEQIEELLLSEFNLNREYVEFNWIIDSKTQDGDLFAERPSIAEFQQVIITEAFMADIDIPGG